MHHQQQMAHAVALVVISVSVLGVPALAQDCPELVGPGQYGEAKAVAVSGDYVYFGSGATLMVANISNPGSPQVTGSVDFYDVVNGIAVLGSYAYVADGVDGLRVIDVSVPSAPVEVGLGHPGGSGYGVAASGGYVYLADGTTGLAVFRDCSLPFSDGFESGDTSAWSATVP